ncbi:MAG: NAD(P)-dependent oxidoreductase, partial [Haliea sp.]
MRWSATGASPTVPPRVSTTSTRRPARLAYSNVSASIHALQTSMRARPGAPSLGLFSHGARRTANKEIAMQTSVIGMGMMGTRLGSLLLKAGHRVTVWNRTAAHAAGVVREGAVLAGSAGEAVGASPVVVVCVKDYAAADEALRSGGAPAALAGRTVLHLSTGSPAEAAAMDSWVRAQGGAYLDGAIQAAPEQMGLPGTPILVSGAMAALDQARAVLEVFGGIQFLGERPSLASAMDFATLSYVYG